MAALTCVVLDRRPSSGSQAPTVIEQAPIQEEKQEMNMRLDQRRLVQRQCEEVNETL
uniref:Uncharacterized protein n=1 Tax=Moniliophthora roreri TaxID=221103 RepID=A0A0W0GA72_MONRR